MPPEKFPQQPLHAVAPGRLAEAPGHHQPQPGGGALRGRQGDPEMARMQPPPLGLDPEIIATAAEPIRLGETGDPLAGWGRPRRPTELGGGLRITPPALNRQAFPTLGPAAVDDLAATPGTHPLQEAVGSGPTQIMGLIGALRHLLILITERFPTIL
jgi:hypothetical protein